MPDPRFERARLDRVRKGLTNPIYFFEMYLRPFDPNWTSAMPRFAQEMVYNALAHDRHVTVLPPEYGKTTYISQCLPVWLTVANTIDRKIFRGMLLSEEERMAKGNLSVVAWHLIENERIASDFIDERGAPLIRKSASEDVWRDDAIIVERIGASKDPTWVAKGLDSKGVHGRRLDWAIADDIITPAHGESAVLRKKAEDKFDLELATRIVRGGHIAVVGNYISEKDLLHELMSREGWHGVKRPSVHMKGHPAKPAPPALLEDEENTELLWPEVWDRQRLMALYREKPTRFRKVHLMDKDADGGEKLQDQWFTRIPRERTPLQDCRFFIGVDSAAGGEDRDLDFFVITVVALHNGNAQLDVVESYATRTSAGRQSSLLGFIFDRWNAVGAGVRRIGIPKVAFDQYFKGALLIVRPDLEPYLEGISTQGRKEERLEMLGPFAESGWLRVWEDLWERKTSAPKDQHQELSLKDEWSAFPTGAHDDRLDSLDVAIRTANLTVTGPKEVEWVVTSQE